MQEPLHARLRNAVNALHAELQLDSDREHLVRAGEEAVTRIRRIAAELELDEPGMPVPSTEAAELVERTIAEGRAAAELAVPADEPGRPAILRAATYGHVCAAFVVALSAPGWWLRTTRERAAGRRAA